MEVMDQVPIVWYYNSLYSLSFLFAGWHCFPGIIILINRDCRQFSPVIMYHLADPNPYAGDDGTRAI